MRKLLVLSGGVKVRTTLQCVASEQTCLNKLRASAFLENDTVDVEGEAALQSVVSV